MLPELRDYLVGATTSELFDVLEDAHKVMERIGLQGTEARFTELLNLDDTVEHGATLGAIVELTRGFLIDIVTEHGIIPQFDILLEELVMLINSILDIQDYEIPTDILDCIQDGVQPEEQLAEMLELVSPWFAERYLEMFDSVATNCIDRIRAFFNERDRNGVAMEQEPPTQVRDAVVNLRNFVEFLENKQLIVMELVEGGLRVGYPLQVYLRTYGDDLDSLDPKRAAEELIAMCLISGDSQSNPRESIRGIVDDFVASLDRITLIDAAIKDILLRFSRYEKA